jgi:hypothetical protein
VKRELLYFPKLYLNLSPDIVSFFPPSPSCDISIIPMRILSFAIAVVGSLGTVVATDPNDSHDNHNDDNDGQTNDIDSHQTQNGGVTNDIDSHDKQNPDGQTGIGSGGTDALHNNDPKTKPSAVTDPNDGSNIIISNEQYVSLDTSTTTLEAILNHHNTVYNNIKDLHSRLQSLGTLTVEAAARIALLSALADLSSRTSQNTISVDEGVKDCAAMIDIVLGELGNVAKQADGVVVGPENGGASGQHGAEQVTEHNNEDQSATGGVPVDANQENNSEGTDESQSIQASTSNRNEPSSASGTGAGPGSE